MPINKECLLDAAKIVAKRQDMRVTVRYSAVAAVTNVVASCAGSVAFGPAGMIAGALVGSAGFILFAKNKYKSLHDIICYELSPSEREDLVRLLEEAIKDYTVRECMDDLADLATIMLRLQTGQAHKIIQDALFKFAKKHYQQVLMNGERIMISDLRKAVGCKNCLVPIPTPKYLNKYVLTCIG